MRHIQKFFLIGLTSLIGCAANSASSDTNFVNLDGRIDENVAAKIVSEIEKYPAGSVILQTRSTGGNAISAMRLGDAMRQHRVSMVVRQYCHSACSQYLMPSAASVRLEGAASIAFHGTPSWVEVPSASSEELRAFFDAFRKREERFLTERAIDYDG